MFFGEYLCSIDSKGRIMLPVKFREKLNGSYFVITKGVQRHLDIYSEHGWEKIRKTFENVKQLDVNGSKLKRHIVGGAQDVEFDSQGRIIISQILKNYANIDKKVMVVGMDDKIEIWDVNAYEENMNFDLELLVDSTKDTVDF